MGWADYVSDKVTFLKWDDGPFQLRSAGEPEKQMKHFKPGGGGYLGLCAPGNNGEPCEHCATGVKVDVSYNWAVVKLPEESQAMLTLSSRAISDLADVRDRLGAARFEQCVFWCKRVGAGKKIRYVFEVAGEAPVVLANKENDNLPF
jgi:hypothetical protein